jgi:voltage-gated potassium channel
MLRLVDNPWSWVRHHPLEVTIVVFTFPVLANALTAIRALRLLRLVRLLRLPALARVAFSLEGLRYVALLAVVTAIGGGEAYAQSEGGSLKDGIYWAITTMTTVGYGDLSPKSDTGKMLALVVMLVGIGFVAILTGAVAQRFVHRDIEAVEAEVRAVEDGELDVRAELRDVMAQLARIEARL